MYALQDCDGLFITKVMDEESYEVTDDLEKAKKWRRFGYVKRAFYRAWGGADRGATIITIKKANGKWSILPE